MKIKYLKLFIIFGPLLFWIISIGVSLIEIKRVNKKLIDPNDLLWRTDSKQFHVNIDKTQTGEVVHYVIEISNLNGSIIQEWEYNIDHDMFGGGFVGAVDIDGNDDLEIIAWGAHEEDEAFYIDIDGENIKKYPYRQIGHHDIVNRWYSSHIKRPMELTLLSILLLLYYLAIGMIFTVVWLVRRRRTRKTKNAQSFT